MLSPSLRSVLKSLLQREDAEERDGWLLLSMEEEEELLGLPIATTHRKREMERERAATLGYIERERDVM